jgi:hypothetical protein
MAYAKDKDEKNENKKETSRLSGNELDKFLKKARERLKLAVDADRHNRDAAIEDLKFLNGEQWDEAEKTRRKNKNRPALTVNVLPKYRNQLVGEQRQNRPRIKVRPVDSKADPAIAKIREGIIANINYLSRFDNILDQAYGMVVDCGYGAWRICTRYTEENPFIQEIYKEPIPNPFLVYWDTSSKNVDKSDAKWCFVLCKYSREDFKDEYPKAEMPGEPMDKGTGMQNEHWYDKESVTVAEYWVKEPEDVTMCLLSDGQVLEESEAKKKITEVMKPILQKVPDALPVLKIEKTKTVERDKIKQHIITFKEELKSYDWRGKFIPVISVYGPQRNIEGKTYIQGLIRNGKDAQRLYNYWYTSAAERIALAPKSPYIGTAKMFEGYEKDWAAANTENMPYLKFKSDPNMKGVFPRREPPVSADQALLSAIAEAKQNVKDTIGMFNSDVGDVGPERSGAAINARQKPGDIATFEFFDNFINAMKYDAIITNDLIPYIMDTKQDVRLRNEDDTENFVPVNTTAGDALNSIQSDPMKYQGMDGKALQGMAMQKGYGAKYNDLTVGKYDIVMDTGPSYATQRMEAAEYMLKLVNSDPDISKIGRDILVKNMDFLGADELATRLRKMLPPGMIEPKAGEAPPKPMPPNPQMLLMKSKIDNEGARQKVSMIKAQVELVKLYKETKESEAGIRQEILKALAELHAPIHPADAMLARQLVMQGQQQMPSSMPSSQTEGVQQ